MAAQETTQQNASGSKRKKVVFICGSLRKQSLNRQMGEYARACLGDAVDTEWLDFADIPYMNQDIEFPAPEPVQHIRDAVMAADAVWVCSPEYNHSIPGVLKNCLDWLSRPLEAGSHSTAIRGKLVTYSCAGGGSVARYVSAALAEVLSFISGDVMLTEHTQVALTREDYTTNVLTMTEEEKQSIANQAKLLLERMGA